MHQSSLDLVRSLVQKHELAPRSVLEVGSLNVNGTYRSILAPETYVGVDEIEGDGVDVVGTFWRLAEENHHWHADFDLVLSGQSLEHDRSPWITVPRMCSCARPGGHVLVVAPFAFPVHHPPDYWRFTDQGLARLFALSAADGEPVDAGIRDVDAWCLWRRSE